MCPIFPGRAIFLLASIVLLSLGTGCHWEAASTKSGSFYSIGITVVPAIAALAVGLIGYFVWRRAGKQ
jgi:hypothetical protein